VRPLAATCIGRRGPRLPQPRHRRPQASRSADADGDRGGARGRGRHDRGGSSPRRRDQALTGARRGAASQPPVRLPSGPSSPFKLHGSFTLASALHCCAHVMRRHPALDAQCGHDLDLPPIELPSRDRTQLGSCLCGGELVRRWPPIHQRPTPSASFSYRSAKSPSSARIEIASATVDRLDGAPTKPRIKRLRSVATALVWRQFRARKCGKNGSGPRSRSGSQFRSSKHLLCA
jgi:hypothetical protein